MLGLRDAAMACRDVEVRMEAIEQLGGMWEEAEAVAGAAEAAPKEEETAAAPVKEEALAKEEVVA